jgi:hypothetical protein
MTEGRENPIDDYPQMVAPVGKPAMSVPAQRL